ncbi:MAG: hypothetical protein NTV22_06140 [bacterium]|nr:hypothetical protein [bacterium]
MIIAPLICRCSIAVVVCLLFSSWGARAATAVEQGQARRLTPSLDACARAWYKAERLTNGPAVMYVSEPVRLPGGVYDVDVCVEIISVTNAVPSHLYFDVYGNDYDPPDCEVALPIPPRGPARLEAHFTWPIVQPLEPFVLRIFSTAEVRFTLSRFRVAPRVWSVRRLWARIMAQDVTGPSSLRLVSPAEAPAPTYLFPVIAGTNVARIDRAWPRLQRLLNTTLTPAGIAVGPGPADVYCVAHGLSLRPNTYYRLRAAVCGNPVQQRNDRVHFDLYSASPLYDPPEADLILDGSDLLPALRVRERYFRTHEVPPAVMLRIMASLCSTVQVAWVELAEVPYGRYAFAHLFPATVATYRQVAAPCSVALVLLGIMLLAERRDRVVKLVACALMVLAGVGIGVTALGADSAFASATLLRLVVHPAAHGSGGAIPDGALVNPHRLCPADGAADAAGVLGRAFVVAQSLAGAGIRVCRRHGVQRAPARHAVRCP